MTEDSRSRRSGKDPEVDVIGGVATPAQAAAAGVTDEKPVPARPHVSEPAAPGPVASGDAVPAQTAPEPGVRGLATALAVKVRPAARRTAKRPKARVAAPAVQIGIISDTHGRLPASVAGLFDGVVHIIHAGDVGKRSVLRRLETIAPVTAVSGNVDRGKLLAELPVVASGEAAGVKYLVIHKPKHLKRHFDRAKEEGVRLIVVGHLHEPSVAWEDGVLLVNPGTASSPEDGDPAPTVALVSVVGESLAVTFFPVEATGRTA